MQEIENRIRKLGIIPVVVLNDAANALPLAQALIDGGLPCAEVTFRTGAAEESIRRISQAYPDMLVGAGTVLSVEQAERAIVAGARFVVAPGLDSELVDYCIAGGIPVFPGVATPSEITQAVKRGLSVLKLFPAKQLGGAAAVKALGAPFTNVSFIPTGGVSADNAREYLESKKVAAIGGSWMVNASLIDAGDFGTIANMTREAMAIVKEVRD